MLLSLVRKTTRIQRTYVSRVVCRLYIWSLCDATLNMAFRLAIYSCAHIVCAMLNFFPILPYVQHIIWSCPLSGLYHCLGLPRDGLYQEAASFTRNPKRTSKEWRSAALSKFAMGILRRFNYGLPFSKSMPTTASGWRRMFGSSVPQVSTLKIRSLILCHTKVPFPPSRC